MRTFGLGGKALPGIVGTISVSFHKGASKVMRGVCGINMSILTAIRRFPKNVPRAISFKMWDTWTLPTDQRSANHFGEKRNHQKPYKAPDTSPGRKQKRRNESAKSLRNWGTSGKGPEKSAQKFRGGEKANSVSLGKNLENDR